VENLTAECIQVHTKVRPAAYGLEPRFTLRETLPFITLRITLPCGDRRGVENGVVVKMALQGQEVLIRREKVTR
jgi:hypothetical protein